MLAGFSEEGEEQVEVDMMSAVALNSKVHFSIF